MLTKAIDIHFTKYQIQDDSILTLDFDYFGTLHLYCVLYRHRHVYITLTHDYSETTRTVFNYR